MWYSFSDAQTIKRMYRGRKSYGFCATDNGGNKKAFPLSCFLYGLQGFVKGVAAQRCLSTLDKSLQTIYPLPGEKPQQL